ncbi:ATP-dependent Clp protease ATP-binding subunit ClpA, partial [Pseudoalteromonas sp. S558]
KLLIGLKERSEEHHGLRYTQKAVKAAAVLSAKYINERHLPDKAIDVIDEAGASQRLQPNSKSKKTIGVADIKLIITKMSRIPQKRVSSTYN